MIQQTLINLFTLVEEQINTARVMRIPHCAIAYGPVKLGYSEEQGVRIFYPDEGMRDEVINQSKQDLFSLQAAEQKDEPEVEEDVEGAEPPSPESLSIGNGVPGTNSEGEPLKVEETAGHQAPLRVDQVETSTDELVTSEAEAAPRREPVDRRDPMFKNESWLRIPLKGMRLKFFVRRRPCRLRTANIFSSSNASRRLPASGSLTRTSPASKLSKISLISPCVGLSPRSLPTLCG